MLVLLFCLFLFLGIPTSASGFDNSTLAHTAHASMYIEQYTGLGWQLIGSGTLVKHKGKKYVLTAKHVAEGSLFSSQRACLILDASECINLDDYLSSSDEELWSDWALFPVEEHLAGSRLARVDTSPLLPGEPVHIIGNPHGYSWISFGRVSLPFIVGEEEDDVVWGVDAFGYPGSSGGGVFNESGRLVGILVAGPVFPSLTGSYRFMEDMPLIVPVSNIEIFD